MSFGYAVGDVVAITQLAWRTIQNTRKACGEHDELTREVTSLHFVLRCVQQEASKTDSIFQRATEDTKEGLRTTIDGCGRVLRILDSIVVKYNALPDKERAGKRLWSKIRFGNGEMQSLSELRLKVLTYTSAITLQLNLISMGSQGRVEKQMDNQGVDLWEIRQSLNWITASLSSGNEGSILTTYAGDDKAVWKELRRELVAEGYSSKLITTHKEIIVEYVKELGDRGALDDILVPEQEELTFETIDASALPTQSMNSQPLFNIDSLQNDLEDDSAGEMSFDEASLESEATVNEPTAKGPIEEPAEEPVADHLVQGSVHEDPVGPDPAEETPGDVQHVEGKHAEEETNEKFVNELPVWGNVQEDLVEEDLFEEKLSDELPVEDLVKALGSDANTAEEAPTGEDPAEAERTEAQRSGPIQEALIHEDPTIESRIYEKPVDEHSANRTSPNESTEGKPSHEDPLPNQSPQGPVGSEEPSVDPSTGDLKPDPILGDLFREDKVESSSGTLDQKPDKCRKCGSIDKTLTVDVCYHTYCVQCYVKMFVKSLSSPQDMLPECCEQRRLVWGKHMDDLCGADFKNLWDKKHEEYLAKRIGVYCPLKGCGEYVEVAPPFKVHPNAKQNRNCARCGQRLCRFCNLKFIPRHKSCTRRLPFRMGVTEEERAARAARCKEMGAARDAKQIAEMEKKYARPVEIQPP